MFRFVENISNPVCEVRFSYCLKTGYTWEQTQCF